MLGRLETFKFYVIFIRRLSLTSMGAYGCVGQLLFSYICYLKSEFHIQASFSMRDVKYFVVFRKRLAVVVTKANSATC